LCRLHIAFASEAPPRGQPTTTAHASEPRGLLSPTAQGATSTPATGFWSFVTAGANASVGRDANVPHLAHFAGGGYHEESL
jgi:hypothetical protein